jgi:hypothetical protein
MSSSVQILVKGRFWPIPGAKTKDIAPNAVQITIPLSPDLKKRTRRGDRAEDWDGAIFLVDDEESEPAVGSGEGKGTVTVTVFFL